MINKLKIGDTIGFFHHHHLLLHCALKDLKEVRNFF